MGTMGLHTPLKREPEGTNGAPDFRGLFETQFSYVWHVLKRLGVAERDLEDLAQQVFLQVHGQLPKFDARRPLRPWLFSFAYHAASNYRALSRHRVELSIVAPEQICPKATADEVCQLQTATKRAVPTATVQGSDLARERALLELARANAARGEPALVLEQTEQYRAQFARGKLAEEREALAIRALLSLGRAGEARTRAAAFQLSYPNSLLAPAIDSALSIP